MHRTVFQASGSVHVTIDDDLSHTWPRHSTLCLKCSAQDLSVKQEMRDIIYPLFPPVTFASSSLPDYVLR